MPSRDALIRNANQLIARSAALISESGISDGESKPSIDWSHRAGCPGRRGQCCSGDCMQGIMTEKALEYFESELKDKSDNKSPKRMNISYMHRDALDFLSTWLGVFKGSRVGASTTKLKSDGEANNASIVTLATTTNFRQVNNSFRAFFGKFGFVSKTLYRSYELLHGMTAVIQGFLSLSSSSLNSARKMSGFHNIRLAIPLAPLKSHVSNL